MDTAPSVATLEERAFIDHARRIYRISTGLIRSVKELTADFKDQYMNYIRGYTILCGYTAQPEQSHFWELVSLSASRVAEEYQVLRYFNPVGQIICVALGIPYAIAFPDNHPDSVIPLLAEFKLLLMDEQTAEKTQARMSYEVLLEDALLCRFHHDDDPLAYLRSRKQLNTPPNKLLLAQHAHRRYKKKLASPPHIA